MPPPPPELKNTLTSLGLSDAPGPIPTNSHQFQPIPPHLWLSHFSFFPVGFLPFLAILLINSRFISHLPSDQQFFISEPIRSFLTYAVHLPGKTWECGNGHHFSFMSSSSISSPPYSRLDQINQNQNQNHSPTLIHPR